MYDIPRPNPPYLLIADILRQQIKAGKFEKGERLPSAGKLAEKFKVTQPTVTRAFHILAKEGYVRADSTRGTFVQPRSMWNTPHTAEHKAARRKEKQPEKE